MLRNWLVKKICGESTNVIHLEWCIDFYGIDTLTAFIGFTTLFLLFAGALILLYWIILTVFLR